MAKLFDVNNPVWRFMGRVADLFFLTMLWAVCSLPILTMGAATAALYYTALKMVRNKEGYLFKEFFKSFRENLILATLIWLLFLLLGGMLGAGFYALLSMEKTSAALFFWALAVLSVVYLLMLTAVFPLMARLHAGAGRLLAMSFMVMAKNFAWLLFMTVFTVCVAAVSIFLFWPLLLFAAGAVAYVHGMIWEHLIFPKYNWNLE